MRAATLISGGREWESNPPETVQPPHTDLKSARPTGDDSLPKSGEKTTLTRTSPAAAGRYGAYRRAAP